VAFLVGDGLLFQINVCKPDVRSIFFAHGAVVDSQRASKK
jgi:hypothetical protein